MSLDNKKADEYLANLANQIKTEISNNSSNDEIFEDQKINGIHKPDSSVGICFACF